MSEENSSPLTTNPGESETNRRAFLKGSSLALAAAAGSAIASKAAAQAPARPAAGLGAASDRQLFWEVETTSGKVQGIANTGIREFKGIPYGAPTGGKNRCMPPRKPASWSGVRECFGHGQISPQTLLRFARRLRHDDPVGPAARRHG